MASKRMKQGNRRGFTLMELMVVIAIVAMLVTVMVPVILGFMKGRGLSMSGNNIGGFVAFARSEAMNSRMTHVIVCYTEEEQIPTPGSDIPLFVGPGMALFRVNPNFANSQRPGEAEINYVRQLDFGGQIGGEVKFSTRWTQESPKGPINFYLTDGANDRFKNKFKIAVLPDGRLIIPEDKPGYVLDTDQTRGLRTDLVLTDGDRFVYIDINSATGAVRRSIVYERSEVDEPE